MERYLYDQNIHWQEKFYTAGVERELLSEIKPLLAIDQIIAVSGIRRCGKSFLLKQLINYLVSENVPRENILFLNLEFPSFVSDSTNEILTKVFELYLRLKNPEGKLYVFLDEIQTVENWETWLKYYYDLKKGDIKFFITGSNSRLLASEFASKLSGRIIEKTLFPFSFREVLAFHQVSYQNTQEAFLHKERILHYFEQYLEYGGMPELLPVELVETKRELLLSYFNTIIYKDIIPRFSLRNDKTIFQLALYLLANTASLLNIKKVSDYLGISKREQTRQYLDYLQQAYFNFILTRFDFTQKPQLLAQKKSFAVDTGFVNLLPLRFSQNKGKLLENAVFEELIRRYKVVYYYRDNGNECDFIIYDQLSDIAAFQVCYDFNENTQEREIKGLMTGCRKIGVESGVIITYDQ
ncbi:MAG: ATP-binding protein, partial [Ignavibacteriales bacterium]|nr:ATP-binding protein [Ignavibacteriales bacterium]